MIKKVVATKSLTAQRQVVLLQTHAYQLPLQPYRSHMDWVFGLLIVKPRCRIPLDLIPLAMSSLCLFQNYIFATEQKDLQLYVFDAESERHEVKFSTGARPYDVLMYDDGIQAKVQGGCPTCHTYTYTHTYHTPTHLHPQTHTPTYTYTYT